MNPVEAILFNNVDKPNSRFIFPTDIAVSGWADHLLRLKGGTVPMNKFMAWDKFKQNSIKSKVQNKKSIPSVLRKIFVCQLIAENAQAVEQGKEPVFTSLIRRQWALQAARFAPWLTGLIPQLGAWFKKTAGVSISAVQLQDAQRVFEGDEKDLFTLAIRYAQFLEERNLFEPAWETPPFDDDGTDCYIFFPESLSDYGEYRDLLAASEHVKTVSAEDVYDNADGVAELISGVEIKGGARAADTFFYTNSRSEITEAALYILALHEKESVRWESIAVCLPNPENYEPYVIREFKLRNIPFVRRSSKPLAGYPAGRFFRDIIDCTSRDFAFSAFAGLVLNRNLPWKDTEEINSLVDFGIRNNCISSWVEVTDGKEKTINVWEDAFSRPLGWPGERVYQFFLDLKKRLNAFRRASSFTEIRRQYFIFRGRFFNMENCSEETNLILSRCISELVYLTEIEKDFHGVKTADPFMFFAEYLDEVKYLAQTKESGVNILPYTTAAAAPFDCHIVLGAGQESLSVVHSGLDFLPRKKREKLGIFDEDASLCFIKMHKYNSFRRSAFFCSEQTFSGFAIPHSGTNAPVEPKTRYAEDPAYKEKFYPDFYIAENAFCSESAECASADHFPEKLHDVQIKGFTEWKNRREQPQIPDGKWQTDTAVLGLIREKFANNAHNAQGEQFSGKYSVSASSLKTYFQCSLKWLFERVLSLENAQIEASLMAENIAGLIYHEILNQFFTRLKETKEKLLKPDNAEEEPALPDRYRNLLKSCVESVFGFFPALQKDGKPQMSSLTSRLIHAGKRYFYLNLEKCLSRFLLLFAGYRAAGSETSYRTDQGSFFLNGKTDCVLELPEEKGEEKKYAIIDFKLKNIPARSDCTGMDGLSDFQLPMYMKLTEENEKINVFTALFYSILDQKPEVIIGAVQDIFTEAVIPKKEDQRIYRNSEKYNQIFEEFNKKTNQFVQEISTGEFSVFESDYGACRECVYNRICRTVYVIKREKNILVKKPIPGKI